MTPVYQKIFSVPASATDRWDRLKLSSILDYMQEAAGDHSTLLGAGRQALAEKGLFWAVLRHRIQITRLPKSGETLTVETWPMPTTRTAYPRSVIARDAGGRECFRAISLWVLMDAQSRSLVVPGKSGVTVEGLLLGGELAIPGSLALQPGQQQAIRTVRFSDLDCNGHMNNCRYLDWVMDTLPADFHRHHSPREFFISYLSEARENEALSLCSELDPQDRLQVLGCRETQELSTGRGRVFAAAVQF